MRCRSSSCPNVAIRKRRVPSDAFFQIGNELFAFCGVYCYDNDYILFIIIIIIIRRKSMSYHLQIQLMKSRAAYLKKSVRVV